MPEASSIPSRVSSVPPALEYLPSSPPTKISNNHAFFHSCMIEFSFYFTQGCRKCGFGLALEAGRYRTESNFWQVLASPGEGNGNPLQYSRLEDPMGRGAWWAAVHGVAKSRTQLSDFTFTFHFHALEKEMAAHSSIIAQRIPGTAEPGGLPSMGLHRVDHD